MPAQTGNGDGNGAWFRQETAIVAALRHDAPSADPLGLEGYDDLLEIRRGGQGIVYSARRTGASDRVAVKVLHADVSARSRLRFLREIELAGQLRHPGIVTIVERGQTADGRPCFVMPYVAGAPLMEHVVERYGPVATRETIAPRLRLFRRICEAVSHAHRSGIIHRDLKPSNIRVDDDGEPHVLDFGLARTEFASASDETDLTLTTQFVGTLAYAAPEQAAGDPTAIDTRTDVYALGVILYEMLSGRRPHETERGFSAALHAIEHAEPPRLAGRAGRGGPAIDRRLEAIVLQALRKRPGERYQSVDALAADVDRYGRGEPLEAQPGTVWTQLRALVRRHPVASSLLAAIALLVVGLAVVSTVALTVISRERGEAVAAREDARAEAAKVGQLARFYESLFASVRPHEEGRDVLVADVLDTASARLDEDLAGSPEIAAALLRTLGQTYQHLGRPEPAIAHLERAVALQEAAGAPEDERFATRAELAIVMAEIGRFDDAERLVVETMKVLPGAADRSPLLRAKMLEARGAALAARSDYLGAEPLLEEVLRLRRGADAPTMEMATSFNNLGMIKEMNGRYDEAAALYREGMETVAGETREDVFARSHLIHNLANLERKLGRLESSTQLFRTSLALTRELHGPGHLDEASTLETLGSVLIRRGLYEEAEAMLDASLVIRREHLPTPHTKTASSIATLGELRYAQARYDEAETLLRDARAMRAELLGPDHWLTAKADAWIARSLVARERFEAGHALALAAYERLRDDPAAGETIELIAVEALCSLYESWPAPDGGAPTLLDELIGRYAGVPGDPALGARLRAGRARFE